MLKRAILYRNQLCSLFVNASDSPENKYFTPAYWDFEPKIESSNWSKQQFVSVDKSDNVIAWLEADIAIKQHYINNISIIRFNKNSYYDYLFSKDMYGFFSKLFFQYEYRKINYNVVIGSPQEKWYDKFTNIYGGRIVGIKKNHFLLENGKLLDLKIYEMEKDPYIMAVNKRYPSLINKGKL